jgi:hypothetical protein
VSMPIGVAWPWREKDRQALREAFPTRHQPRVRAGSVLGKCVRCDIPVAIGPRLKETRLKVVCPLCAHALGMTGFWPVAGINGTR